jgi:hypothetical protein
LKVRFAALLVILLFFSGLAVDGLIIFINYDWSKHSDSLLLIKSAISDIISQQNDRKYTVYEHYQKILH